ncbi:hypothetical protein [Desulfopila sp. IMCC35008]|uniref:hypothetical protein n=1 Tax=Desulfopila sp. IMCC35008 TaxID=2653858 RepID=UPI0013D17D06|nr:hypothetical protein [Desulfopila sp. IMCC35008]
MLPVNGLGYIARDHAVYYMEFFYNLSVLQDFQAGPLDDQVVLVLVEEILGTNFRDKCSVRIFFGIAGNAFAPRSQIDWPPILSTTTSG